MSSSTETFTPSILRLIAANPRMELRHAVALTALSTFLGGKDHCWPALSRLATLTGRARGVVGRWLKECAALGYIAIDERYVEGSQARRSSVYRFAARILTFFRRQPPAPAAPAAVPPPQPVEQTVESGDNSPARARAPDSARSQADSGGVTQELGKEAVNEASKPRLPAARERLAGTVERVKGNLEAFARRGRAPQWGVDPEQRRLRRVQKLMQAASRFLAQAELIQLWTTFADAALDEQRRAMDRLEALVAQHGGL